MSILKSHEIKKFRKTYTDYDKECTFTGYKLAVLFDEKDDVKKWGGRWDADGKIWWMPYSKLKSQVDDETGQRYTIHEILNSRKMIMGQYGEFQRNEEYMGKLPYKRYTLYDGDDRIFVNWFETCDAVEFVGTKEFNSLSVKHGDGDWYTVENARKRWDELVADGYIKEEEYAKNS